MKPRFALNLFAFAIGLLVLSATLPLSAAPLLQGGPEINVRDGATNIPDGTGSVTFPTATVGSPSQKTFTVQNTGSANLTISSPTVPAGFALIGISGTTVAPGGSRTFTVRCNAASGGTFSGQLSFANNDANENPYNFTISCTVNGTAGQPEINVRYAAADLPDNSGSVLMSTTIGTPVSATFTVQNTGTANLTLSNLVLPNGFTLTSVTGTMVAPGNSITFTIRCDATGAIQYGGPVSFTNNDANENPYNFTISCIVEGVSAPEINVRDGATNIPDGTGSVTFPLTTSGTSVTKIFTVENTGNSSLNLSNLSLPGGFALTNVSGTLVQSGNSITFTIRCNASSAGTFSGTLSFANNDPNENPYNFAIACTVTSGTTPEINVRDDATNIPNGTGSVNFGTTTAGNGINKTFTVQNLGTANLTLSNPSLPPGFTLTGMSGTTVTPGSSITFTIRCNAQSQGTFSGQIVLTNNDADENSYTFAISCTVSGTGIPEINVRDGATNIPDGTGSITFPATPSGTPVSKIFTVQNTGTATLNLSNLSLPAGFALTSVSGTTVAPGGSTTFTIRCNAASAGTFSGTLSFVNNDPNENPYNFTISCTVNALGPEIGVFWGFTEIPDNTGSMPEVLTVVQGQGSMFPFRIVNTGDQVLNLSNITVPTGFADGHFGDDTLDPGTEHFLYVTCTAETVGMFSGTLSFSNNDANENPYNFTIFCDVVPAVPEINVTDVLNGHATIPDNTGSVNFGTMTVGNPVIRPMNIFSEGNSPLTIGTVSVPAGFTVTEQPDSPIQGSIPSTFRVRCDATAPGTYSGTLSFSNNDANENPYNFTISCTVNAAVGAVQGEQQLPDLVTEEPTATEPPVIVTDVPTEAPTLTPEPPTAIPTETPTEPPTEVPTEVVVTPEATPEPVVIKEPSDPAPEGTPEAA